MFSIIVNISTCVKCSKVWHYILFCQIEFLLSKDRPMEYAANVLASWIFKIKSNSASKECKEFLVQYRREAQAILLIKNSPPPWISRGECLGDLWKIGKATVLMPRSLLGFLCVPPVPYLCNSIRPTSVSAVWTVVKCPVHSHWARLGWFWCLPKTWLGEMSALSKQPSGEGDRWIRSDNQSGQH